MSALLIDVGNTRIKWLLTPLSRPCSDQDSVHAYAHDAFAPALTSTLRDYVAGAQEQAQAVVALGRDEPELRACLEAHLKSHQIRYLTAPLNEGIEHCYRRIERLGVDRWLAMLGTRRLSDKPAIVASAGTALTIDLLNAKQQHEGGWIVPGLTLASHALFDRTQRVNDYDDEALNNTCAPGTSTRACVYQGVLRQQIAMVRSVMADYPDYELWVTGGDGRMLAEALSVGYAPHLIFEGMKTLCAGSS